MNIRLEQLEREDFPVIKDWIDPEIFHIFKWPIDDKQLERLLTKEKDGVIDEIGLRAVDIETKNIIGLVHSIVNRENNLTHLQQIVVDPERRGKGYGATILEIFLELCFMTHKFHRVQLFTEENNKQAIVCYKKVGFHVDGLMRDMVKTDKEYLSTYIFSMLDNEWYERKTAR